MPSSPREEIQQMVLVARFYYEDGLTQEDVARELKISRPTVSRLLQRAREEGIVQIAISDPFFTDEALGAEIARSCGLQAAIVIPAVDRRPELSLKRLGLAAARYLEQTLKSDDVLGVGWGRTLYAVSQSLAPTVKKDFLAVPLLGGLGQISPNFQVHEITRAIAEAFGGSWKQLYVPALVRDEMTKANLLQTKDLLDVVETWGTMTKALVGIGNFSFDVEMQMLFASYLDEKTRSHLQAGGAVGDICVRFFDIQGNPVEGLVGATGIELEQLRRVQQVIGVAGGVDKAEAILGAVRGKYIQVLITDDLTAKKILSMTRSS
ncbi:transcriptional regulator, contains sigma factor-related N-terminal domain [Longilinea arvoryzae]|uniref:Transcriptional regulator, contains sigma factor-related N-terminal domain n=1 Tax=Longilinea arvoryzae TaxID=360412 RepID=A0A0S7B5F3_9CHLR|nr:sugar-binding transcriptional regulator [Longilinea arvoryzae]GAP12396.1 transcriptional regulator, contains sigma factor-related N-terminal domain [Longilinea arvoryzae]